MHRQRGAREEPPETLAAQVFKTQYTFEMVHVFMTSKGRSRSIWHLPVSRASAFTSTIVKFLAEQGVFLRN